MPLEDTWTS